MKKKNPTARFSKGVQSDFGQKVYLIVSKIPKGKTMTYVEVSRKAGRPAACRAVGSILGKNRNKEVPCHRVIRSDGGMGGYAFGGVKKKAEILKKEGALH